jgi:hypothetical protein
MDTETLDAGQRVWTEDGVLCTIHRFYTTLPGNRRAVLYPIGADASHGTSELHADTDTLSAESEHGVGGAFDETVSSLDDLTVGDLLYAGSITCAGEPNVLRVLRLVQLPGESEPCGFIWQFVDLADPLAPRIPSDQKHFCWDFQIAEHGYRRADFLAGLIA